VSALWTERGEAECWIVSGYFFSFRIRSDLQRSRLFVIFIIISADVYLAGGILYFTM
jgi:hypothetical protein